MVDSSASSFSSSSSADDRRRSRKRQRSDRKKHIRRDDKHERHHKNNFEQPSLQLQLQPCTAAPSDWDELRRHYQFVLPTDDDYINDNSTNNDTQTNTWQQRMVKNYHEHLYKEYVLADLSRVLDIGKIGLRWRTEKEVADGKGFRSCGNLMCKSSCKSDDGAPSTKTEEHDKEAYAAAVKRHMGIAVPENGGKEPLGVLLPTATSGRDDDMNVLDSYLLSCAQEHREVEHQQQRQQKKHSHKQHKHKSKHKRKHKQDKKYKDEDDTTTSQYTSLKEQEQREQQRLSVLPYDLGLHDYEVDFVYTEQQIKKRELVKVRLCLRCAPLLFVANSNNNDYDKGSSSSNKKKAPAVKAREAREKAARSHLVISRAT